jgi:genome maintenance exonuclease 1
MRTYYIDGETYYSVTSILSLTKSSEDQAKLDAWRGKVGEEEANRVSEAATVRGTALHKWCEDYCNNKEPIFDEESALPFWPGVKPVLDEISDIKFQETQVYHPDYKYAGTLDCYGTFRGIPNTLIDFKTSSKYKKFDWIEDYCIQAVAYAAGVNHCYGIKTYQAAIVIALPDKPALVYTLNRQQMTKYWKLWINRLEQFHNAL